MGCKSSEYANDADKLHNFKRAAAMVAKASTPAGAAWNMALKHFVSLVDMIEKEAAGEKTFTMEVWREKLGDAANYLDLIYSIEVESHE